MTARRSRVRWNWVLAGGIVLVVGGVLALVIAGNEALPQGPVPVVWNRTSCAECGMAVSERGYAAQLQTRNGEVLDFDDPGCLFRYLRKEAPGIHEIYFHHVREDRWIRRDKAAFIPSGPSPMGFDLGAVDGGTSGALSYDDAMRKTEHSTRGGADAPR